MTELETRLRILGDANVEGDVRWAGDRITTMIWESMIWLQSQLIKQGSNKGYWLINQSIVGFSTQTLFGLNCMGIPESSLPSNVNRDVPVFAFYHSTWDKKAERVDIQNFEFLCTNTVLMPTTSYPVFTEMEGGFYCFPDATGGTLTLTYTRIPTAPTYNDNSDDLDFPIQYTELIIERVVMQIKAKIGDLQTKQLTLPEIDAFIMKKYQLEPMKEERKATE